MSGRRGSSRPTCGRGIRTAVVRTDQRYLADAGRRLEELTVHGSFAEALAFVSGYDAARASSYLAGFQRWLVERMSAPSTASIHDLVLAEAGVPVGDELPAADDRRATERLFDLLDEYLETRG
ncbi:MAG TPA: hypothetical protein VH440_12305 [Candidatus Limnocylindrales bacterium]